MRAIILVGGFGTRLRTILPDVPKPMAPIGDKPFLAYLLDYLQSQGVTKVVLAVHHLREQIQLYFASRYANLEIEYAIEPEPLGTGGAIVHALTESESDEPCFILNGDTFVKLDFRAMYEQHQTAQAMLTIVLRSMEDCSRYGKVVTANKRIIQFREKGEAGAGFINAGVYLLTPALFARYTLSKQFSFEKDFLQPYMPILRPHYFVSEDYFIDIGIPEDYDRATQELGVQ